MFNKTTVALFLSALGFFVCLALLVFVTLYSRQQLSVLSRQTTFDTPEAGMVAIYGGPERAKVSGVGVELFSSLRYVSAVVESDQCSSGPSCSTGGCFLQIDGRWVFVSEGRLPLLIATGQKMLQLLDHR